MRKLIFVTVLALLIFGASAANKTRSVEAAPTDCDLIGALCRLTSSTDYQICLLQGGAPDYCAWKEAEQTIQCLRTAGCGDIPKGPGDN